MATELAANPPSFSGENPFLLVREALSLPLSYVIRGAAREIHSRQYAVFDAIFKELAREQESIADGAAAELAQASNLPEEVLAVLWDDALRAAWSSKAATCETRQGYLSKDEFFVLLAELQLRLGVSDEQLAGLLGSCVAAPRPRRNPFNRQSLLVHSPHTDASAQPPPRPPKLREDDSCNTSVGAVTQTCMAAAQHEEPPDHSLESPQTIADGFSEYIRSFGNPFLAATSPHLQASSDLSLPIRPLAELPAETVYDAEKEILAPEQTSPRIQEPRFDSQEPEHGSRSSIIMSASNTPLTPLSSGSDYCGLEVAVAPVHWDGDDFGPIQMSQEYLHNQLMSREVVNKPAEPSLSSIDGDRLALERLKALLPPGLVPTTPLRQKRSSGFDTALTLVRRTATTSKRKPLDPDTAGSGFPLRLLAEALQDAVVEGNLILAESLFKLGANANFSSVQGQIYHHILQVAVAAGNSQMIDLFLANGADGTTIDSAFITAFYADHLDVAFRLVAHADVYRLNPLKSTGPQYQELSASSLGCILRDRTMPGQSRSTLLDFIASQDYFDAHKVVFQVNDTSNNRVFDFSTVAALASQLDLDGLKKIIPELANLRRNTRRLTSANTVHSMGAICCIRPSHWQLSSDAALAMLKFLVYHSADVGETAYWPGQGAMSSLACAVAGGSLEGVSLLLGLDADPECLIYQHQPSGKEIGGYSALGWAALHGRLEICALLIEAGATPWRTSFKGYTPLYLACRGGSLEVVKYLLSLDIERSMVDHCLLAAVKGDEPQIVEVLLLVGASIAPGIWNAIMARSLKPHQRSRHLETIDLLLAYHSTILEEAVLAAIDSDDFAGLSRILERRNGILDFDCNAPFNNWRWACTHCRGDCWARTCLRYAETKEAWDFVSLLMSYGWVADMEREGGGQCHGYTYR